MEVQQHLSDAFPGTQFTYQSGNIPVAVAIRKSTPFVFRLWSSIFAVDNQYPKYEGDFTPAGGGAVQFHFPATEPVKVIVATFYGRIEEGIGANFNRLIEQTGWRIKFPRF